MRGMIEQDRGAGGDIIFSGGVIDVNVNMCLTFTLTEEAARQIHAVFGDALRDGKASVDGVDVGGAAPCDVAVEIIREEP